MNTAIMPERYSASQARVFSSGPIRPRPSGILGLTPHVVQYTAHEGDTVPGQGLEPVKGEPGKVWVTCQRAPSAKEASTLIAQRSWEWNHPKGTRYRIVPEKGAK